jgi:putative transposase
MFQDEAGFGRINKPKYCWCYRGVRPSIPCHHIREYRYAYGAVEPLTGESFFLILPFSDTVCMNIFLGKLSEKYQDDTILLVCDGAAWHKAHTNPQSKHMHLCGLLCAVLCFPPCRAKARLRCHPCTALKILANLARFSIADWYKALTIPHNIRLLFLPPATPEMNPIEQIWKELRKRGFRNEIFHTIEDVINRLCDTISSLSHDIVRSITARKWILECF